MASNLMATSKEGLSPHLGGRTDGQGHKLSELTSSSSWARISATGAESVLVPKAEPHSRPKRDEKGVFGI